MRILVTPTSFQPGKESAALETLKQFSSDLVFNPTGRPLTEEELIPLVKDIDGYLAGLDYISEKVLAAAPKLKVVSRYGAGYDRVDIAAARKYNIKVTNTPGANANAVAELAMGLAMSLARRIAFLDRTTREGGWVRSQGMELRGKTMGVVGLGAIGKRVAAIAQGFGMSVMAYDPYMNEAYAAANNIEVAVFADLIKRADVISLHLPITPETKHIVNAACFESIKPTALLINTSRGGLIDEDAAYKALTEGRLGGLALDAFEIEPPVNSPLLSLDNVVVTPHTGAHTKEAVNQMAAVSVDNLIKLLQGEDCDFIIK